MGCPKGLIEIGGRPLVERLASQAREVTDRIYICSNAGQSYAFLGFPVIPDIYEGQGPLAGLHAVMQHSPGSSVLLLACDLPNVHSKMFRRLIELTGDYDIVAACTSGGNPQPLCGIYRGTCRTIVEDQLQKGVNKVMTLLSNPALRLRLVGPKEGDFADSDLFNLNSPEGLRGLSNPCGYPHI
jgi:molybdopterin-guanine dinucleotide biosynthesis protein A